jgi:hypothetical protein
MLPSDNRRYYQEDLSSDNGKRWSQMLASVIRKANYMEFRSDYAETKDSIKEGVERAEAHIKHLGLSRQLACIYSSLVIYQKEYVWYSILVRLRLSAELKKKVSSYQTLEDLVIRSDDDIFDPAFYFNDTPLLWTVTSMSFANLLLNDLDKQSWQESGFDFDSFTENNPLTKRGYCKNYP